MMRCLPVALLLSVTPVPAPREAPIEDWIERLDSIDSLRAEYRIQLDGGARSRVARLVYEAPDRLLWTVEEEEAPLGVALDSTSLTVRNLPADAGLACLDVDLSEQLGRAREWLDLSASLLPDWVDADPHLVVEPQFGLRPRTDTAEIAGVGPIEADYSIQISADGSPALFGWLDGLEADDLEAVDGGWRLEVEGGQLTLESELGLIRRITSDDPDDVLIELVSLEIDVPLAPDELEPVDCEAEEEPPDDLVGSGDLMVRAPLLYARNCAITWLLRGLQNGLELDEEDTSAWTEQFALIHADWAAALAEQFHDPFCEAIDDWVEALQAKLDENREAPDFEARREQAIDESRRRIGNELLRALAASLRSAWQPEYLEHPEQDAVEAIFELELGGLALATEDELTGPVLEYFDDRVRDLR